MRCEDAIKNMDRFVNHKMTTGELEDFLKHVDSCPSCYEELETYYTVAIALHYLKKMMGKGTIFRCVCSIHWTLPTNG